MSYPRFTYRDFIGMNDPKEIISWLKDRKAKYLGCGASRQVFRISQQRVIKIEYSLFNGRSQNKNEVKTSDQFGKTGMVTKCFWYHPKYVWIISEYANKIDHSTFKKWYEWQHQEIRRKLRVTDLVACNCGRINNRIVIVDCGLSID